MRGVMKDLTGAKFGMLTVLKREGYIIRGKGRIPTLTWLCRCDCGMERHFITATLTSGNSESCGCRRGFKHGFNPKGGSPTMSCYRSMLNRMTHPVSFGYDHYKKRGITLCDRWRYGENGKSGFECFLADMGPRPSPEMTVDRIDNDGNYEPGNCQWATRKQQAANRSTSKYFNYYGEKLTVNEIVERTGLSKEMLRHRLLRAGWTVEEAVTAERRPGKRRSGMAVVYWGA
jgi:hypothetical protein